ncbi:MAG: FHA domain-containing protein [Sandaracinaceae bacterium]|nr:FHA domain-containing protein [Sandaracinaceae bacterium]
MPAPSPTLRDLLGAHATDAAAFCRAHPHAFLVPAAAARRGRRALALGTGALAHPIHAVESAGGPWAAVTVGRSEECDVVLDDPRVSRHHATFERREGTGEYALLDAGSRNGVRIGAARLSAWSLVPVASEARISFGGLELIFLSAADLFALAAPLGPAPLARAR